MRIYQLAKKHGISSAKMIGICESLGFQQKKPLNAISDKEIVSVEKVLAASSKNVAEKTVKPAGISAKAAAQKKTTVTKKSPEKRVAPKPEKRVAPKPEKRVAPKPEKVSERKLPKKKIKVTGTETVGQIASKLEIPAAEVIKAMLLHKIVAVVNQSIGIANIKTVCDGLGVSLEVIESARSYSDVKEEILPEELKHRAPVVTIMGHVDHGKTAILDAIRKSSIAKSEHGEITQQIGAYKVSIPEGEIVFLDTPGHEAFSKMRAHGAQITDIVVLVIAADEGVKNQTVEAIGHARSAGVPIIVAINKIDKPNLNLDSIKQQLAEYKLIPEAWGGDTIFVNVSALKGEGIHELLEMILLTAEMMELKASPNPLAEGVIIESEIDKTRGPALTVLIQNGTLKIGDVFVAGTSWGKVRTLLNDWGERVYCAKPSTPVKVLGANEIANPGEKFSVLLSEKKARERAAQCKEKEKSAGYVPVKKLTLEDISNELKKGLSKELNIVLKTDCIGSIQAIKSSINKIGNEEVKISVLLSGTGPITKPDILLASASEAIVIGFNVSCDAKTQELIKTEGVDVRMYQIIYELLDDIKKAAEGILEPIEEEVLNGHAIVKKVFNLSKNLVAAGCQVVEGKIIRGSISKVVRAGNVVHEGTISSLKRVKEQVKEVRANMECGIGIDTLKDIQEGDIIQSFTKTKSPRKL